MPDAGGCAARNAGYDTICDIGRERIRRAGDCLRERASSDADYGFRLFTLR